MCDPIILDADMFPFAIPVFGEESTIVMVVFSRASYCTTYLLEVKRDSKMDIDLGVCPVS